jgi:hypothetical protein
VKHKFYYYEYSDDGGNTWTLGDYRRYLMDIVKLVREIPYRFRICNQDGIELNKEEIKESLDQMNLMDYVFGEGGWL